MEVIKSQSNDFSKIKNIVWLASDGIITNPRGSIEKMENLPKLDYSFINVRDYYTKDRKIVHYISSYGCPYACTFCAEPEHSLRKWNGKTIEIMVDEFISIHETTGCDRISFVDPNMSSNPWKVIALCKLLIDVRNPVLFNCNMRAKDIVFMMKKVDVSLLYKAGFRRIFVGVESGSDSQLKVLKKSSNSNDHFNAIMALDKAGIEVQASFIHDLPNESFEQAMETLELSKKLINLNTQVRINPTTFICHFQEQNCLTISQKAVKINLTM